MRDPRGAATRETLGRVSFSSSIHFPGNSSSSAARPVTFPPGRARLATKPTLTGSPEDRHDDGDCCGGLPRPSRPAVAGCDDDVHLEADQVCREIGEPFVSSLRPAVLDDEITALDVTEFLKRLPERLDEGIGRRARAKDTDAGDLLARCALVTSGAIMSRAMAMTKPACVRVMAPSGSPRW